MFSKIMTACHDAIGSFPVEVEVHLLNGLPHFQIVGLADNAVREAKERIRSAILQSGFHYPMKQIIVNLSPNDKPKGGSLCEVAIAIGILMASEQIDSTFFEEKLVLGSLSLDGRINDSKGIMAASIKAIHLPKIKTLIIPEMLSDSIRFLPELQYIPIAHLNQVRSDIHKIEAKQTEKFIPKENNFEVDMADIIGQPMAKTAMACCAIGGHHSILIGDQGSGKTMLARAFVGILPQMNLKESLEVTEIYTNANLIESSLIFERPFRMPHHTSSDISIIGGGVKPNAGEISLAHNGILFFDELLEFKNNVIQSLREPLEQKKIRISRARGHLTLPANFIFIGATNHCFCGNFYSKLKACTCNRKKVLTSLQKIMGPFLDRISFEIELHYEKDKIHFLKNREEKNTDWYRSKIIEAKSRMVKRNNGKLNCELSLNEILSLLEKEQNILLQIQHYSEILNLSHRSLLNSLQGAISYIDFFEMDKINEEVIDQIFSYKVIKKYHEKLAKDVFELPNAV